MPIPRNLRVYANPYLAFDHEGRPASPVPFEPDMDNGDTHVRYVGATRHVTELRKANENLGIPALHDHAWDFSPEPQLVPNTDYYRRAVKSGELIAADVQSWTASGCDARLFAEPKTRLRYQKAGAQASHRAHHGVDSPAIEAHWAEVHNPTDAKLDEPHASDSYQPTDGKY